MIPGAVSDSEAKSNSLTRVAADSKRVASSPPYPQFVGKAGKTADTVKQLLKKADESDSS